MKKFIFIFLLISCIGCYPVKMEVERITYLMEYAYHKGQKDALEGCILIEKSDSVYLWIKSPWSNSQPKYDPIEGLPDNYCFEID
jgi:hypothetical protein